jgi:hypothetical protein
MSRSIASDLRTLDLRTLERRTKRAIARFSNPHSITEKSRPADNPDLFPAGLEFGAEDVNGQPIARVVHCCYRFTLGVVGVVSGEAVNSGGVAKFMNGAFFVSIGAGRKHCAGIRG